jgi:molecular chaperone DnaK
MLMKIVCILTRNQAEAMINATEKSLTDLGDQVEAEDKTNIESAIAALKSALEGTDKDDITAKTLALTEASGKLAEKAYADNADGEPVDANAAEEPSANASDDVVDAEFEEVKDDKK